MCVLKDVCVRDHWFLCSVGGGNFHFNSPAYYVLPLFRFSEFVLAPDLFLDASQKNVKFYIRNFKFSYGFNFACCLHRSIR